MKIDRTNPSLAVLAISILYCFASTAVAQDGPVIAGKNGTGDPEHIIVPFTPADPNGGHWVVGAANPVPLIANPKAPPMEKWFLTPTGQTLPPGWSAPVWENFLVWPGDTSFPDRSPSITDWHEHIHEPGWEWEIPPQSAAESLITRDGQPWDWKPIPPPPGTDPNPAWLWVEFPPIEPGHILDIHKRLVWRGTDGNKIWGDHILDDGTTHLEEMIAVWEYPTIPEPSTFLLGTLATVGLFARRRRS